MVSGITPVSGLEKMKHREVRLGDALGNPAKPEKMPI